LKKGGDKKKNGCMTGWGLNNHNRGVKRFALLQNKDDKKENGERGGEVLKKKKVNLERQRRKAVGKSRMVGSAKGNDWKWGTGEQ